MLVYCYTIAVPCFILIYLVYFARTSPITNMFISTWPTEAKSPIYDLIYVYTVKGQVRITLYGFLATVLKGFGVINWSKSA